MNRPRAMRHRLTIQVATTIENALGEIAVNGAAWRDVGPISADVSTLTAGETSRYKQVEMDVTHRVLTRFTKDLTPTSRLAWPAAGGKRILNIKSVVNVDDLDAWLEILATVTT